MLAMIIDKMDKVLAYLYEILPARASHIEIIENALHDNGGNCIDQILQHLIKDNYLVELNYSFDENSTLHFRKKYTLTIAGILFCDKASVFRRPYHSADIKAKIDEKKQEIERKIKWKESWPKRNWLLIGVIGFVFGILGPIISEWCKRKLWPESKTLVAPGSNAKDTLKQKVFLS